MPRFSSLFSSGLFKKMTPLGLSLGVLLIIFMMVFQPFFHTNIVSAAELTLTAENSDSLGVDPQSTFLLESKENLDMEAVQEQLHIQMNRTVPFTLKQIDAKKIRLAFEETLSPNELLGVTLNQVQTTQNGETQERPYQWAFQVKETFRVLASTPGNKEAYAPAETGVEVVFSHQHVDLKKFEQAFHIEPSVEGTFTSQDRSFAFVPKKLEAGTVYTVTIDKSLTPEGSEETLGEDYTFSFETNPSSLGWFEFSVSKHYVTVSPSSTITIPYYAYSETSYDEQGNPQPNDAQSPLHVKLFQFLPQENQSAYEQFVEANRRAKSLEWRAFTATDELLNTSTLTPVSEFDAQKINSSWENYFLFPESLQEGYYFAQVALGSRQTWLLIASSPLTAYVAKANNQTLIWVNDALTKQAVTGADVRLLDYGTTSTATDSQGLGTINVSTESSTQDYLETDFLEVKQGDHAILLTLTEPYALYGNKAMYEGKRGIFSQPSSNYWSYLYTDRPMYQTTDTLKLWGYLEKRSTGERPSEVRVWIGQTQWCDYSMSCTGERPVIFDETLLRVNKEGTFEGTLGIDQMPPGYYQVTTEVNGEEISSKGINISEYTKPAYTLTLTPDAKAVFADEPVEFTVQAEFFEGTPVKGLEVDVSTEFEQKTLALDENGKARGSFSFSYEQLQQWGERFPVYKWISAKPHRPEEGQIETSTNIMVFGPRVYIDVPWNQAVSKEGQGEITFTTRNVEPIYSSDPTVFGSNVLENQLVNAEVIEVTYVSHEVGSSYDFISKKNIKQYTYDRQEKKILDFTVTTDAQGKGLYRFDTPNKKANYEVLLSSADSSGLRDKATSYVWMDQSLEYGQNTALQFKNKETETNTTFQGYALGQTVHLSVEQNWKPFVPEPTGRFLYLKAQNGIQEIQTSSSPAYEFSYETKDIPNVDVYGVYFNGEAYAEISGNSSVSFDTSSHELEVSIAQDKSQYRPGEKVSLSFDVHDADNQPVAAQLNINIVDEAFYALASEEVNPLQELFHFVESGVLVTQTSEELKQFNSMAEGGGGGDRGRFVFKDTALFKTIQTEANGKGTLTFTLPDNITSWRVTTQALETDRKLAGKKTAQVAATLPFFIQPTLQKSYLREDRPIILLRANGTEVNQTQPVTYSVSIANQETEQTITSTVGETAYISLPELPLGETEITIHGETQQTSTDKIEVLTDTITRSINVVSSRLTKSIISTYRLNDHPTLSGSPDELTWVTFIDGNQGRYYGELSSLSYQSGERADQAATRMLARELLNQTFNETEMPSSFSPSVYQGQGIRLFPYSSESIELTAQIALLQDTPFDEEAMKIALRNQLFPSLSSQPSSLTTREIAQVYAALAALGEPVLAQTQQFLTTSNLGVEEQLYGALALWYSGHKEGARAIYQSLIAQTQQQNNARWTALLAVLSSGLNEPEADQLYSTFITQDHEETLLVVEQLLFIKNRLQTLPEGTVAATYHLEGGSRSVSLEKGETFSLALTPEELQALQPEATKGEVMLVTRSTRPFAQEESDVQENLLLTRSYYSDSNPTTTFKEGELVKIKLRFDIPISETQTPGTFELIDLLPSGLEVITPTLVVYQSDMRDQVCQSYPTQVKDQQISFFVSNDTSWNSAGCELHTVVYYARVVTPGTYVAESAMMSSVTNPEIYTLSDSSSLTISQ